MVDFADRIVSVIGRFGRAPNTLVAAEVERRGGVVRRGLSRRTAIVAIGRRSLADKPRGETEDGAQDFCPTSVSLRGRDGDRMLHW